MLVRRILAAAPVLTCACLTLAAPARAGSYGDLSYVLEVSGTASGPSGGSYTGTLNLSPVPLPSSFPLLLTGLLGFAGLILPRSRDR